MKTLKLIEQNGLYFTASYGTKTEVTDEEYNKITSGDYNVFKIDGIFNFEEKEESIERKKIEYIRLRKTEYPEIGDQLDALWKEFSYRRLQGEAFTQNCDDMLGKILEVKSKYPKPE